MISYRQAGSTLLLVLGVVFFITAGAILFEAANPADWIVGTILALAGALMLRMSYHLDEKW